MLIRMHTNKDKKSSRCDSQAAAIPRAACADCHQSSLPCNKAVYAQLPQAFFLSLGDLLLDGRVLVVLILIGSSVAGG